MTTGPFFDPLGRTKDEGSLLREVAIVRQWVSDLMARLGGTERVECYHALILALHAFRDCLPREEAVRLGVSLPPLLRGLYFEGWRGDRGPATMRTYRGFLLRLETDTGRSPCIDPEGLAHDVLALLSDRLPASEADIIRAATPVALQSLWPDWSAT